MEACLATAASAFIEDSPSVREFGLCHVAFLDHLDSALAEKSYRIRLPGLLQSPDRVQLGLLLWYFWSLEANGLWGMSLSFSHGWHLPPMGMLAPGGGCLYLTVATNTGHPIAHAQELILQHWRKELGMADGEAEWAKTGRWGLVRYECGRHPKENGLGGAMGNGLAKEWGPVLPPIWPLHDSLPLCICMCVQKYVYIHLHILT